MVPCDHGMGTGSDPVTSRVDPRHFGNWGVVHHQPRWRTLLKASNTSRPNRILSGGSMAQITSLILLSPDIAVALHGKPLLQLTLHLYQLTNCEEAGGRGCKHNVGVQGSMGMGQFLPGIQDTEELSEVQRCSDLSHIIHKHREASHNVHTRA